MVQTSHRPPGRWAPPFLVGLLLLNCGCHLVPQSRLDECQRLSQTLRSDNARLKDQALALQSQNRDYAERAMDDLRRIAVQEQAIERLERSVQAYQGDRERLGEAYERLTSALGRGGSSFDPRSAPAPDQAPRSSASSDLP